MTTEVEVSQVTVRATDDDGGRTELIVNRALAQWTYELPALDPYTEWAPGARRRFFDDMESAVEAARGVVEAVMEARRLRAAATETLLAAGERR